MANVGRGFQGAASGAASGAALGSIVPGLGTGIGAGVGAGLGFLGGLFGGGGGGSNIEELLRQIQERSRQIQPRLLDRSEMLLRQNLAGGSRAQSQAAVSEQRNTTIGRLFAQMNQAELDSLQLLLGAEFQQQRLQQQKDQQLLAMLSQLGLGIGDLLPLLQKQTGGRTTTSAGLSGLTVGNQPSILNR